MPTDPILTTEPADISFEAVRASFQDSPQLAESLATANVVLLPMFISERNGEAVFGTSVREVYRALSNKKNDGISVELAYDGDSPPKLVLHGDLIVLGTLLVEHVVVPAVMGVLSAFIYEKIRQGSKDPGGSEVRCSIIVEEADGSTHRLEYKGPASSFEKLILEALPPGDQGAPE